MRVEKREAGYGGCGECNSPDQEKWIYHIKVGGMGLRMCRAHLMDMLMMIKEVTGEQDR